MRTITLALVSCGLLVISQGAPAVKKKEDNKRCCQPAAPDCFNPCPPAAPDFSFMPPPPPPVDPCCAPGPSCFNPCPDAMSLPPPPAPPLPPPPPPPQVPLPPPTDCCTPGPSCDNPCLAPPPPPPMAPPMAPPMGGFDMGLGGGCCDPMMAQPCANPCPPPAPAPASYAPYPGEITMKLLQNWNPDTLLDHSSAGYKILEGNLKQAIKAALAPRGMQADVTNVYFREGSVPGNPSTMPKTVAHFMVNGGSDAASLLEAAVTPDGTLGDGLKVYKDSFNAY